MTFMSPSIRRKVDEMMDDLGTRASYAVDTKPGAIAYRGQRVLVVERDGNVPSALAFGDGCDEIPRPTLTEMRDAAARCGLDLRVVRGGEDLRP